jgi:hypothetical protein
VAAALIGLFVWYQVSAPPKEGQPVANVRCDSGEQLAAHYHAHLDIFYQGTPVPVPPGVGITNSCFYWLHTHKDDGIIHIEAPADHKNAKFTLGEFFQVWKQPLNKNQVATISVGNGQQMKVWVNGKPYHGDPNQIVLTSHESVAIEVGPSFQSSPPPVYPWTGPNDPPQ